MIIIYIYILIGLCKPYWPKGPNAKNEFTCRMSSLKVSLTHLFPSVLHSGISQRRAICFSEGGGPGETALL